MFSHLFTCSFNYLLSDRVHFVRSVLRPVESFTLAGSLSRLRIYLLPCPLTLSLAWSSLTRSLPSPIPFYSAASSLSCLPFLFYFIRCLAVIVPCLQSTPHCLSNPIATQPSLTRVPFFFLGPNFPLSALKTQFSVEWLSIASRPCESPSSSTSWSISWTLEIETVGAVGSFWLFRHVFLFDWISFTVHFILLAGALLFARCHCWRWFIFVLWWWLAGNSR